MHKVLTYTIGDFMMASPPQFLVMPEIQQRARFPFTVDRAERFFAGFRTSPFKFDGIVLSIVIHDGMENLPHHSYAAGWLYEQSLEQLAELEDAPEPVGSIYFQYHGTTGTLSIRVEPTESDSD